MTGSKKAKMTFRFIVCLFVSTVFFLSALPAGAGEDLKPQILVDQALVTLNDFVKEADMEWFRSHLKNSKGVFIVPQLLKAGFIFGGSGGRGVVLLRDAKTGQWSQPAFYSLGSVRRQNRAVESACLLQPGLCELRPTDRRRVL